MKVFFLVIVISQLNGHQIENDIRSRTPPFNKSIYQQFGNGRKFKNLSIDDPPKRLLKGYVCRGPLRQMFPTFKQMKDDLPQNSGTNTEIYRTLTALTSFYLK